MESTPPDQQRDDSKDNEPIACLGTGQLTGCDPTHGVGILRKQAGQYKHRSHADPPPDTPDPHGVLQVLLGLVTRSGRRTAAPGIQCVPATRVGATGWPRRDTAGIEPLPEFAAVQLADQSDLSWLAVRQVFPRWLHADQTGVDNGG